MAGRSRAHWCDHSEPFHGLAKPQSSRGSKDLGRRDPEALDELPELEAKLYQQDTGISICISSGRFDMQFRVKRLSEVMSKPLRMGDLRLARLSTYLVGTQKLSLRFDHQEWGDSVRIPVGRQGGTLLHPCRA